MSSTRRVFTGLFLILFTLLMLFLMVAAISGLVGRSDDVAGDAADDTVGSATDEADPAAPQVTEGPATTIPLAIDAEGTGTVSCSRSDPTSSAFQVTVQTGVVGIEPIVLAIDLIGPDGARQSRVVELQPPSGGGTLVAPVQGSDDMTLFVQCAVTAIQQGERVILTGS